MTGKTSTLYADILDVQLNNMPIFPAFNELVVSLNTMITNRIAVKDYYKEIVRPEDSYLNFIWNSIKIPLIKYYATATQQNFFTIIE